MKGFTLKRVYTTELTGEEVEKLVQECLEYVAKNNSYSKPLEILELVKYTICDLSDWFDFLDGYDNSKEFVNFLYKEVCSHLLETKIKNNSSKTIDKDN